VYGDAKRGSEMSWKDMMRRVLPPIDGVQPDITSRYGEVEGRPASSTKPHRGVDFNYRGVARLNRSNPAMRAPVTGVVTKVDKSKNGTIAIRDSNGFSHEILHSRTQHVAVGDPVVAGQLIGTMGNTGLGVENPHDRAHVHFQLRDPAGRSLTRAPSGINRARLIPIRRLRLSLESINNICVAR
jgi:murein DD-endopeptidase MepM/ murein hydrolase activator NlpD